MSPMSDRMICVFSLLIGFSTGMAYRGSQAVGLMIVAFLIAFIGKKTTEHLEDIKGDLHKVKVQVYKDTPLCTCGTCMHCLTIAWKDDMDQKEKNNE